MKTLTFNLLGGAEIKWDDRLLTGIGLRKARAILYYLVTTGHVHSRSALAGLLWETLPEENARRNLRKALTRLRKFTGDSLLITRHTVTMHPEVEFQVDVTQFWKRTAPRSDIDEWKSAITLYRGEFLDGFYVRDAPAFEHWMLGQRALLRDRAVTCLQQIAGYLAGEHDDPQAISYAKRLLELEPWREETHRLLMSLYARSGQIALALAQYETCRQIMVSELGIEPDNETQQLMAEFRRRAVHAPLPAAPTTLPAAETPLIGRETELDELKASLQDPAVRLLTITGIGGAGKTRLALAVASQLSDDDFPDGRFFSSFEAQAVVDAHDEETIRSTLAVNILASMKVSLSPRGVPFKQMTAHLRKKRLLLILDSFEALLLPDLAPVAVKAVREILAQATQATLLLTSRQPLRLRAEWLYDLDGLALPTAGPDITDIPASVRLFDETARRQNRRFDAEAEREAVRRICRLVAGLPLGIELAAGLIREQRCAEIAAQIEQTLEGVAGKWRDLPPRQRSLKSTFEYTWQLLARPEQQLLAMLAYMRRGTSHDAIRFIVGNLIQSLDTLAAKSLVKIQDERIYLHEVVLEFARQKLDAVPPWLALVTANHARYFLGQLEGIERALETGEDYPMCQALRPDLENIRIAWRWAVTTGQFTLLDKAARGLMTFFYSMGWLSEGIALLEMAIASLQTQGKESESALINCLLQQGLLAALGTDTARANELAALTRRRLDSYIRHNDTVDLSFLQAQQQYLQGYAAHTRGDWSAARKQLTDAAVAFARLGRTFDEARAYFVIGNGWMGERKWQQVVATGEKVLALCRDSGNLPLQAKTLATMAVAYSSNNCLEQARTCRAQAQELSAQITWPIRDEIVWLGLAAEQALDAAYLDEAARHIERVAPLVVKSGSMFYEDWNHIQHGHLFLQIGEYGKAMDHYERARACTIASEKPSMTALALTALCMLCYRWGKADWLAAYAQALSAVTAQLDEDYYGARAASWTALSLLALNRAGEAAPGFSQALRETTDEVCVCEARWGFMNCYTQQGNPTAAYETALVLVASPLFEYLPSQVTELLLPFQIYYDCWQALGAVDRRRAEKVLQIAGTHLRTRLRRIENEAWRIAYLQEATLRGRFPLRAG